MKANFAVLLFLFTAVLPAEGPETCKPGFVWREACGPNDHVCVPVATRTQAASDNGQAAARRQPGGGAAGPDTCKPGFVWREACGPQDHVCVPVATRTQAAQDNNLAASRFLNLPVLWDVLTQNVNPARTGAQLHETILNPSNVRPATFGRLYERSVDGQVISQVLYESNQWIPGKGLKNVAYVATRKNWVYAFDADDVDPDPSKGLIWRTSVPIELAGRPMPLCLETRGPVGVTSTPVIDRASDTMYLAARKNDGTIWLHALDLATGNPKSGTPGGVRITASAKTVSGNTLVFDQALELQRTGLLLQDGAIYLGFSALNCDNKGWHGWVLAYRAPDLQQVGAFVTTQSDGSQGAGIWQSGNGLVGDGAGNIYFETGNGTVNGASDLGESFVKLHSGPPPLYGLALAGHYTVSNFSALNGGDTDLGAGGPVLLPGNRLVGGGKQGKLYVFDTGTMKASQYGPAAGPVPPGGSDGLQAFLNSWHDNQSDVVCTDDRFLTSRHCFEEHARYEGSEWGGPNIHLGPLYWDDANPAFGLLYGMPEKDFLRSYRYDRSKRELASSPFKVSSVRSPDGMPGAHLTLSANGSTGGIIWASVPKYDGQWAIVPASLVAFDAISLAELWRDDDDIAFAKFNPPTVAGGKVFRPTFANRLIVYGLRTTPAPAPCYTIAQKYQNYSAEDGLLGNSTGPESSAVDGIGRFQHFSRTDGDQIPYAYDRKGQPDGSIYWSPSTCAHEVNGVINSKWSSIGREAGAMGYPITDEMVTPDGLGRYNHFQSGSIYWSPLAGAHEVHGAIRSSWESLGWERSALGYPISDEIDEVDGSGRFSLFEHGSIHWRRDTGAISVHSDANTLISLGHTGADRPGSNISDFNLPAANPSMCQQSCADNSACRSWTYVNPGVQGPQARCWLKNATPIEQPSGCCTSGIKVDVKPANMPVLAGRVNRPGSDFTNFDLPSTDYRLCQGECSQNATCRAWTYVEPQLRGPVASPPARCWLKNVIPGPQDNNACCISGAKQ
jgi:LGFP repeat/PAN domain